MNKTRYYIIRFFRDNNLLNKTIIKEDLTLEEAQKHCSNPQTSSSTCTTTEGKERTKNFGLWFDGYGEA